MGMRKSRSSRGRLECVSVKNKLKWYSRMLRDCAAEMRSSEGKVVHCCIIRSGADPDLHMWVSLINLYAKCGDLKYSRHVFEKILVKDAVSWTALISGFVAQGRGVESVELFCEIRRGYVRPNEFTLASVLKGCSLYSDLEFGKQMHAEWIANSGALTAGQAVHSIVIKVAGEVDDFVRCSLLNMYSKGGVAYDALKVFGTIKYPDIVAWSSIIGVFGQGGLTERAAKLFNLMRHFGAGPNEFTLSSLISAATDLGDLCYGHSIHACAHRFGFESDDMVSNALVAMYMKLRSINDGYLVFSEMSNWDVVSWNSLLSGLQDYETSDQGTRVFRQMLTDGFRPNIYTIVSILSCCSSLLVSRPLIPKDGTAGG
ncbi:hypothetical protein OROHE_000843 [Orobanche hederae]